MGSLGAGLGVGVYSGFLGPEVYHLSYSLRQFPLPKGRRLGGPLSFDRQHEKMQPMNTTVRWGGRRRFRLFGVSGQPVARMREDTR